MKVKQKMTTKSDIPSTTEYTDMLDRFTFVKFCKYLKMDQGKTLVEVINDFGEDEKLAKYLIDIWVDRWHTFYNIGGRIILDKEKYYCLSPRNPKSRERNPVINEL